MADDPDREPARIQAVYDEIADHFAETRAYPWPEVEEFLAEMSGVSRALDIGSGNGRHTALLADCADTAVGFDISRELLGTAKERMADDGWEAELVQGDGAALPFRSGSIDVAVYVATLHHLSDRGARVASLRELGRVLDGDGRALVSAWSTAHDRFDEYDGTEPKGFDTTVDWTLPGGETVGRFYHIYAPEEFAADLSEASLTVEDRYVSSGNCYAEVTA
ncbi:class I SAM-dependent methyltransferase [Halovenus sp. HT40]|uniref:class I SAM-dependent methyltransferase n=1 Tax=Halovenus sp. HT40 TaxID=3126691 RepID=UPI00300F00CF